MKHCFVKAIAIIFVKPDSGYGINERITTHRRHTYKLNIFLFIYYDFIYVSVNRRF